MKKVLIRGPALSRSEHGEHTRFILRSLRDHEDFDLYLFNIPWGSTSWIHEDSDERKWIDSLLMKTLENDNSKQFDLAIQITIPTEWQRIGNKNIGITSGAQANKVPEGWLRKTFSVDKMIVPSSHAKNSFLDVSTTIGDQNGQDNEISCITPIDTIAYPVRNVSPKEIDLNLNTSFNFLTISKFSPRKNIESSLLAFLEEFQNEEDVGYVLKLNIKNNCLIDSHHTEYSVRSLLENYPDRKCKVYLLHGDMSDEEMAGLYEDERIKGYVSSSHVEGFGLPIFEACTRGLPVIASFYGGYTDFTTIKDDPAILTVEHEIKTVHEDAIWEGVTEKDSEWSYINLDSLRKQMRELYKNGDKYQQQANKLKNSIRKKYTIKKQNKKIIDSIKEVFNEII